jgi:hypothetical protein
MSLAEVNSGKWRYLCCERREALSTGSGRRRTTGNATRLVADGARTRSTPGAMHAFVGFCSTLSARDHATN